jgi:hypothetical protein
MLLILSSCNAEKENASNDPDAIGAQGPYAPVSLANLSELRNQFISCGVDQATLEERIYDCSLKNNGSTVDVERSLGKIWKLVTKNETHELWQDLKSGLLWSDHLGTGNWCMASGDANTNDTRASNATAKGICSVTDYQPLVQSSIAKSFCHETVATDYSSKNQNNVGHLSASSWVREPALSEEDWQIGVYHSGKGAMGSTATPQSPSVTWRVPKLSDLSDAQNSGLHEVVFKGVAYYTFWLDHVYSTNDFHGFYYNPNPQMRSGVSLRFESISIRCVAQVSTLPTLQYNEQSYTLRTNVPFTTSPRYTGVKMNSGFSIAPELPSGLSLNPDTGVISGTPTQDQSLTSYEITAVDDNEGTAKYTIGLVVNSNAPFPGVSVTNLNQIHRTAFIDCGTTQNTIQGRIDDCAVKNNGSTVYFQEEDRKIWKLVTRNSTAQVWKDMTTGKIWSSSLGTTHWCNAAGDANSNDTANICNSVSYQPNVASGIAKSYCNEEAVVSASAISPSGENIFEPSSWTRSPALAGENWGSGIYHATKGGMGLTPTSTSPSLKWTLPGVDDIGAAYLNGFLDVVQAGNTGYYQWASQLNPSRTEKRAYYWHGGDGNEYSRARSNHYTDYCVGVEI